MCAGLCLSLWLLVWFATICVSFGSLPPGPCSLRQRSSPVFDALFTQHVYTRTHAHAHTFSSMHLGILPRLLGEILETRVMVKNTMKMAHVKSNKGA